MRKKGKNKLSRILEEKDGYLNWINSEICYLEGIKLFDAENFRKEGILRDTFSTVEEAIQYKDRAMTRLYALEECRTVYIDSYIEKKKKKGVRHLEKQIIELEGIINAFKSL